MDEHARARACLNSSRDFWTILWPIVPHEKPRRRWAGQVRELVTDGAH
jgi:hypothetical protein